jgi:hypothetical protein
MKFPDASGVPANMLPLSDSSAFDQLKLLVDSEGANLAASVVDPRFDRTSWCVPKRNGIQRRNTCGALIAAPIDQPADRSAPA